MDVRPSVCKLNFLQYVVTVDQWLTKILINNDSITHRFFLKIWASRSAKWRWTTFRNINRRYSSCEYFHFPLLRCEAHFFLVDFDMQLLSTISFLLCLCLTNILFQKKKKRKFIYNKKKKERKQVTLYKKKTMKKKNL